MTAVPAVCLTKLSVKTQEERVTKVLVLGSSFSKLISFIDSKTSLQSQIVYKDFNVTSSGSFTSKNTTVLLKSGQKYSVHLSKTQSKVHPMLQIHHTTLSLYQLSIPSPRTNIFTTSVPALCPSLMAHQWVPNYRKSKTTTSYG